MHINQLSFSIPKRYWTLKLNDDMHEEFCFENQVRMTDFYIHRWAWVWLGSYSDGEH